MSKALTTEGQALPIHAQAVPTSMVRMVEEIMAAEKIAAVLAKSPMIPKEYFKNPDNIVIAMLRGQRLGLDPIQSMEAIAMVNGKATLYGDHFLGVIIAASGYQGHDEMTFDEIEKAEGGPAATCTFYRNGQSFTATYSKADAVRAGLWNSTPPWKKYPSRMLQMRARGFAGRNGFSDALKGMASYEEAKDKEDLDNLEKPKLTKAQLIAQQQVKPTGPVVDAVVEEVAEPGPTKKKVIKKTTAAKVAKPPGKKVTKKAAPKKRPAPPKKGMAK